MGVYILSKITLTEAAAPATPDSGKLALYAKTDGKAYIKDDTGTETDLTASGGSSLPVTDTTSIVEDPVDATKEMRIDVGAVATGTVRVLTMPDSDVTLPSSGVVVGTTDTQTLTNKTIDPASNTIDGDKLDIDFTPSNYTPDATPSEADDVDDLAAHLKGIDTALSSSGGAMTLLADDLKASAEADFDFTSISGSYKALIVFYKLKSDDTTASADFSLMTFNNDTGSNYSYRQVNGNTSWSFTNGDNQTSMRLASAATEQTSTDDPNAFSQGRFIIYDYANTDNWKVFSAEGVYLQDALTSRLQHQHNKGVWESTSAINRITVVPTNGSNWAAESRMTIYGVS